MPDANLPDRTSPAALLGRAVLPGPLAAYILGLVVIGFLVVGLLVVEFARRDARAFDNSVGRRSMGAALQDLSIALKSYQTEFGVYPPSPNAALVRTLQTSGQNGSPYYKFLQEHISPSGELLDRWQRPFVYKVGVKVRGGTALGFRLYSLGPNGADENGGGDDISVEN